MDALSFCMVSTFYPPYHSGGEAMYLYCLSNELARRGHRVTVVHCVDSYRVQTSAPPRGDFPHEPGVTVHRLRSRVGRVSPLITYLSGRPGLKAKALDRIFADERFDVVHFHLMPLFGPAALRYGGEALRLYTMHDHWLVCPMYDLWKENRELCEEPQCTRCQLSFRRPPQLWRHTSLLERSLPEIDVFFAPSRSTIEQHHRRGFPYPIQHLPYFLPSRNGADPSPSTTAPAREASRPYFLFAGRLVRLKGVHTLIDVFRRYTEADLVIAGDGALEDELRRQADGLDHVHFLGRVPPPRLRELYTGAIAVLVPALAYETFGLIALEAFANGTPVIARDLGAVAEVVRESEGGLLYSTDDDLVALMEGLRGDPSRRDALGLRGQEVARERWSEEAHLDTYLAAIAQARSARSSREPVSA